MLILHGGAAGVRDEGLLLSALARPQQLAAYAEDADLIDLAAAYTFGIVRNHPFVDGNKRTGFVVGVLFLELNGAAFAAPEEELAGGAFVSGRFARRGGFRGVSASEREVALAGRAATKPYTLRRRSRLDRCEFVREPFRLHAQIVFRLHVHEPLRVDPEKRPRNGSEELRVFLPKNRIVC